MDDKPDTRSAGAQFQRRIQDVFERALDLAPEAQGPWLERECGDDERLKAEVIALLSAVGKSGGFLESEQVERSLRAIESIDPGESVGPYEVERELGRGGMGVVLLARRADGQFEQQVALKLLKRGLNSKAILAGFLRERQILAWLQHPKIARLYDGGLTAEGNPWFALEYVQGRPITEYCAERKLDLRARVRLIIDACDAVHHAHRNLVIHRDLKPSNILVTDDGDLKLLDFGIATVLEESEPDPALSALHARAMTPEYAAPEQLLNQPVTTATDIHALGVLLYELLTGSRPHRLPGDTPEGEREATDSPRNPPSRVAGDERARRFLRGDLDRILLKAIHTDPERRYTTAEAFAEDLRRYLAGRPVSARRQTAVYRLSRFARRNRWGLVGAAAAVAVVLAAGIYAANQGIQARREEARARSVKDFLVNLVDSANPNADGGAALRDEAVLSVALERAGTELEGEPDMQAELYTVVGRAYIARGDLASAVAPLTEALELRRRIHGNVHPAVADAAYSMAALLRRQERYEDAERYYQQALDIQVALNGPQSLEASVLLNGLGANAYGAGDLARAERYYRESLAIKMELLDEDHEEIAAGRHNLALLLLRRRNYEEAEPLMRQALQASQRVNGADHPVTAMSHGGLGRILHETGRYVEADREFRRSYEIRLTALGGNHPYTRNALGNVAINLYDAGDLEGAEEQFRSLLSTIERDQGKTTPEYIRTLCNLGDVLVETDRLDEAEAVTVEAETLAPSLTSEAADLKGRLPAGRGAVALARGRIDEALSRLSPAVAAYAETDRLDTREGLGARVRQGDCLSRLGRYAEADSVLFPAYRTAKEKMGYTLEARLATECLRKHLIRAGREDEAAELD